MKGIVMDRAEMIQNLKRNIIAIGRLLWDKDLVTGLNGNISARIDDNTLLISGARTCLGLLQDKDIILADFEGRVLDNEGTVSSEFLMHSEIYKKFPQMKAVIHSHTAFTNAYFLGRDILQPRIFETRLYLGEVRAVEQNTPSVTDVTPVIEALRHNNVAVLRQHGVVATGLDLFACFLLIQCLEEAAKIDAVARLYHAAENVSVSANAPQESVPEGPKEGYDLFSRAQIDEIVRLVNADAQMTEMGTQTAMNMTLAVHLSDDGRAYKFTFENGRIVEVTEDQDAEFVITAGEDIWRMVFKREIDPFVATTQKRMQLKGDFARISKWYAPCSRIFELWQQVPVK